MLVRDRAGILPLFYAVDGDRLVYCAMRPRPPYRDLRWSVYAIDLATGEERELTPWLDGHASSPRLAPDGTITIGLQFDPEYYADPVRLASLGMDATYAAVTAVAMVVLMVLIARWVFPHAPGMRAPIPPRPTFSSAAETSD